MGNHKADILTTTKFCLKLCIIGIVFRFLHLMENRSLWLDEAYLALNILESSFQQILHHHQIIIEQAKAPLIFSLLVKSASVLWGSAEVILRLVPFVASVVAIFLFYRVAKDILGGIATTIALSLFIFCDRLVYYAAELKPYSTDVCVVLMLYALYSLLRRHLDNRLFYILLGVVGVLAIWASFPAILVLAAIGLIVFVQAPAEEKPFFFIIGILWGINVAMVYKFSVSTMLNSSYITGSIADWFPQAPLWTSEGLRWAGQAWGHMWENPLGQPFSWMCTVLFAVGVGGLWIKDRAWCLVLVLPVLMVFIAAVLGKYPFYERHLLFAVPILLIVISHGLVRLSTVMRKAAIPFGIIVYFFLLAPSVETVIANASSGREHQDNRSVMEYMLHQYEPGDGLYLNTSAQYMFAYYLDRSGREVDFLQPLEFGGSHDLYGLRIGKIDDDRPQYSYEVLVYDHQQRLTGKSYLGDADLGVVHDWSDIAKVRGTQAQRSWIILSHSFEDIRSDIYQALDGVGRVQACLKRKDAEVCLVEWRSTEKLPVVSP